MNILLYIPSLLFVFLFFLCIYQAQHNKDIPWRQKSEWNDSAFYSILGFMLVTVWNAFMSLHL